MKLWIQTATGKRVSPLHMIAPDVCIEDIAHSLALTNRFTGHTPKPYSVAQHSYIVSTICNPENALWGLLHDAPEAYMADISRPVKAAIKERVGNVIKEIDTEIMHAICDKFGLRYDEPADVKKADAIALANEGYAFFGHTENWKHWDHNFSRGFPKFRHRIKAVSWKQAESMFLNRFHLLTLER